MNTTVLIKAHLPTAMFHNAPSCQPLRWQLERGAGSAASLTPSVGTALTPSPQTCSAAPFKEKHLSLCFFPSPTSLAADYTYLTLILSQWQHHLVPTHLKVFTTIFVIVFVIGLKKFRANASPAPSLQLFLMNGLIDLPLQICQGPSTAAIKGNFCFPRAGECCY